ncbi:hypothetical protein Sste5346_004987 [Sporothrix stenoceras]|uniref:Uncharacterized protein n=1 Tax=Sporothrix stenoceras TaxID=5173 RepID=A0ABR3Z711_9PEZI
MGLSKLRRAHLEQKMSKQKIACRHTTETTTSPHVLVVTKTAADGEDEVRIQWAKRMETAICQFRTFDQEQLKVMLGSEYNRVVAMECLFPPGSWRAAKLLAKGKPLLPEPEMTVKNFSITGVSLERLAGGRRDRVVTESIDLSVLD